MNHPRLIYHLSSALDIDSYHFHYTIWNHYVHEVYWPQLSTQTMHRLVPKVMDSPTYCLCLFLLWFSMDRNLHNQQNNSVSIFSFLLEYSKLYVQMSDYPYLEQMVSYIEIQSRHRKP